MKAKSNRESWYTSSMTILAAAASFLLLRIVWSEAGASALALALAVADGRRQNQCGC